MGNRFFDSVEHFEGEIPSRVYALIDRRVGGRVLLEVVDADWTDRVVPPDIGLRGWGERLAAEAPIGVLDISARSLRHWRPVSLPHGEEPTARPGRPGRWIEIELGGGNDIGLFYSSLFGPPRPVPIAAMRRAPEAIAARLDRAFSLNDYVVDEATIAQALAAFQTPLEWVGVYDVGQGSANGLCDGQGVPRGYFDLGGGILANRGTFPPALIGFCTTAAPPVVLSHWDWDHWSSGARFAPLSTLPWVVPNQQLGAVHATFAAGVRQLLVWPSGLTQLTIGQVTIVKCTGNGRNHSGLAMRVAGPLGEPPILLTGDARYPAIPGGMGQFTSVVVPHHGADMRNANTPTNLNLSASRTAYSYGMGNSFKHPRSVTYQQHHRQGWPQIAIVGMAGVDRHTIHRGASGLGHIGLNWSGTGPLPMLPCGGACALGLVQR